MLFGNRIGLMVNEARVGGVFEVSVVVDVLVRLTIEDQLNDGKSCWNRAEAEADLSR